MSARASSASAGTTTTGCLAAPRGGAGIGIAPGGGVENVSEYVAPPGYAVVAPDWDRELRRPVLLRCDRCAALVLGAADSGRHDAWHDQLMPRPRVTPA